MRDMSRSDRPPGDPDGTAEGFRPSAKQIVGAVVAIVLLVFIAVNN
ncbi:MAG: hypothetical protein R2716_02805 [Microthrixaceae bacterium]